MIHRKRDRWLCVLGVGWRGDGRELEGPIQTHREKDRKREREGEREGEGEREREREGGEGESCLLYTSDAADER